MIRLNPGYLILYTIQFSPENPDWVFIGGPNIKNADGVPDYISLTLTL
jgi:hypothetical protein